jgi:hypothetical protein
MIMTKHSILLEVVTYRRYLMPNKLWEGIPSQDYSNGDDDDSREDKTFKGEILERNCPIKL